MSEVEQDIASNFLAGESLSAGMMLRAAREGSGLHIAALAVAMKVPVKKLEALEADRLDLLPDVVFIRALASSVCRALKIDARPILAKLPQSAIPRLGTEQPYINAPYDAPNYARQFVMPSSLKNPSVVAVIVLLFAALFLFFSPKNELVGKGIDTAQVDTSSSDISPAVTDSNRVATEVAMPPTGVVSLNSVGHTAELLPSLVPAIPPSPDLVSFKVRGASWVEVADARGIIQLRKTLAAGESVSASGELPLSVVVGRADVTEVLVRGQQFSLDGISKENVARFEVK